MADQKVTDRTVGMVAVSADIQHYVQVDDPTDGVEGTSKQIIRGDYLKDLNYQNVKHVKTITDFDDLVSGATSGKWLISNDISLTGNKTLPSDVTLSFNDAVINLGGYTLTGDDTKIEAGLKQIFTSNGSLSGTWDIEETYPEWFSAAGDGSNDDTLAIQMGLSLGKRVSFQRGATYKVTSTLIASASIKGNSAIISFESGTFIDGITYNNINNFKVENIKITSTNLTGMFAQSAQAINITDCDNFIVENCELTYFTDGVSVSTSNNFSIRDNNLHEMGEELIAVRYSTGWTIETNLCYTHNGDGVLIKGNDIHGGLIQGNTVKDGVNIYGLATIGGGITCNLEGGDTTPILALSIKSNIVSATVYGIVLVGAQNFDISENKIFGITDSKGIWTDSGTTFNPNSVKGGHGIINGNIIIGIADDEGIVSTTTQGVNNLPCIISNNYVDIQNSIQNSVRGENAIITGNMIIGGKSNLNATDCVVNGNIFGNTDLTADAGIKIFLGTTFTNNVMKGWNNYIQVRADFIGSISGNVIDTNSSQNAITILSGAKGAITSNYITNSGIGSEVTEIGGVSVDSFTSKKNVQQSRNTAPTTGSWLAGDIVWDSTPSAGNKIGWVCVTSGTPGTWKTFGVITV